MVPHTVYVHCVIIIIMITLQQMAEGPLAAEMVMLIIAPKPVVYTDQVSLNKQYHKGPFRPIYLEVYIARYTNYHYYSTQIPIEILSMHA